MISSQIAPSIQLCIHKFELNFNESIPIYGLLIANEKVIGQLKIGKQYTFPLTENCKELQIIVKDLATNFAYGSFTMPTIKLAALSPSTHKHWVPLQRNSSGKYKSDYTSNDTSIPRILLSCGVLASAGERCACSKSLIMPNDSQEVKITVRHTISPVKKGLVLTENIEEYDSDKDIEEDAKMEARLSEVQEQLLDEAKKSEELKGTPREKVKYKKFHIEEAKVKRFAVESEDAELESAGQEECEERQETDGIMGNLKKKVCALAEENERLHEEVSELKSQIKELIARYQSDIKKYNEKLVKDETRSLSNKPEQSHTESTDKKITRSTAVQTELQYKSEDVKEECIQMHQANEQLQEELKLSLIHICRCRRYAVCRSRWSPYH
eukprot:TRINITY_DN3058_c0_g2_i1.p1 TRINITY_DN3058_c0_g2~~TRINITY_DN3058_c0_g2_i1.p1  ORF type:complete len:383 (-),score=76.31 TRINITY_DN3058_c0_g2_i1:22-1170(-)